MPSLSSDGALSGGSRMRPFSRFREKQFLRDALKTLDEAERLPTFRRRAGMLLFLATVTVAGWLSTFDLVNSRDWQLLGILVAGMFLGILVYYFTSVRVAVYIVSHLDRESIKRRLSELGE